MEISKESIVDEIKDGDGSVLECYRHDSYRFQIEEYFYSAKSYIDEPDQVTIAGLIFQNGIAPKELTIEDMNSEEMDSIVEYLKSDGKVKIQVLTEEGYQTYPFDQIGASQSGFLSRLFGGIFTE